MAVNSITLTDPVSGYSVTILGAPGVSTASLEVEPAVRAVTEDRVGSHGAFDTTLYLSAAAVTLNLLLYDPDGTPAQATFLDALGPLLGPGMRPSLIVGDDEWASLRQLTVRLDSMSKARSDPTNWPVQITWAAPDGVWENTAQSVLDVPVTLPSTTGIIVTNTTGLHISATNGLDMPPTSSPGEFQVTNPGTVASQWTAQLYGPATGPKLANDATGLTLEFTDHVVLPAGSFIALDSRARTALLNNNANSSVLTSLNFGTSSWWTLQPGVNTLRYYPTSGSAGAEAVVSYRSAWMT